MFRLVVTIKHQIIWWDKWAQRAIWRPWWGDVSNTAYSV